METLKAKIFINGKIELLTGMHIGGSTTILDIGGIDSAVVKTPDGIPYIPGSSLKGKLRTLYSSTKGYAGLVRPRDENENRLKYDEDDADMTRVFGSGATDGGIRSRLIVSDSYLDTEDFDRKRKLKFFELERKYTESKWENSIARTDSKAIPRQIERVPAGSVFSMRLIYSIYDATDIENLKLLFESLRLLQDDYLGSSGSRGYGRLKITIDSSHIKTHQSYITDNQSSPLIETAGLTNNDFEHLVAGIRTHLSGQLSP